ncbi:MAG: hypothetical protein ACTHLW_17455 [Verrucomicrobiota bacterium]
MSAISFAVHKKSGGEIKVALVPDDRSGTARVGLNGIVIFASLAGLAAIVIWFTIHN